MNAKRIAKQIVAGEPAHWVTAAARRILAGEDFDAVMQDLAQRHALHSAAAFNSVERELRARVEQERVGREAARIAVREGPATNDRDFFKSPAPTPDMTIERFRSIAIEVLRDKSAPFTVEAKLEHIKAKGDQFGLHVDDNWLRGLLREADDGRDVEQLGRSDPRGV